MKNIILILIFISISVTLSYTTISEIPTEPPCYNNCYNSGLVCHMIATIREIPQIACSIAVIMVLQILVKHGVFPNILRIANMFAMEEFPQTVRSGVIMRSKYCQWMCFSNSYNCQYFCYGNEDAPLCVHDCYNNGDALLCTEYCYNSGISPICENNCGSYEEN